MRNVRDPISCLHGPTVRQNAYKYFSRFIVDAFYWTDTKEGHDFWRQVDKKMAKIY